jgi:hypothetical protein
VVQEGMDSNLGFRIILHGMAFKVKLYTI